MGGFLDQIETFGSVGGRGRLGVLAGQTGGEDEPEGRGPGRRPGAASN